MRARRAEAGVALLISIFILLLISVVAIALIVSSGTESALAGNYRSSTDVYYAALAGVEEVRARLASKNPNSFINTDPSFLPAAGTPLAVCSAYYVLNPLGSESVTPWISGSTYADNEFGSEFLSSGCSMPSSPPTANSIWKRNPLNTLSFPGPLYKWVRINAVSEQSLNVDVSPYDGTKSPTTPIYYDGTNLNDQNNGSQVLEITALAVLPNGSQKLVQYLAAPAPITLPPLLAALTLSDSASNPATFHAPAGNSSYSVQGNNYDCSGNPSITPAPAYPAIGVFTTADTLSTGPVIGGIPSTPPSVRTSYTGSGAAPDVENIAASFPPNLLIPANLDALAQTIIQNADVVITPGPTQSPICPSTPTLPPYTACGAQLTPLGMSPSNILTVVVQGNLDISNWSNDGYGLLLVTGTFTYDPDTTWNGIVFVVGQGIVNGNHLQYKQINGAMFVAKTRDGSNHVLAGSNLGGASVSFTDTMQGYGIRYSNCWIQKATPTGNYKILSFHEIAQ
jgi:hypothetical protein